MTPPALAARFHLLPARVHCRQLGSERIGRRAFATYLTWIFYAPALVLTALSSYDLDGVF
jgi:hypothetical protein